MSHAEVSSEFVLNAARKTMRAIEMYRKERADRYVRSYVDGINWWRGFFPWLKKVTFEDAKKWMEEATVPPLGYSLAKDCMWGNYRTCQKLIRMIDETGVYSVMLSPEDVDTIMTFRSFE